MLDLKPFLLPYLLIMEFSFNPFLPFYRDFLFSHVQSEIQRTGHFNRCQVVGITAVLRQVAQLDRAGAQRGHGRPAQPAFAEGGMRQHADVHEAAILEAAGRRCEPAIRQAAKGNGVIDLHVARLHLFGRVGIVQRLH